MNRKKLTWIVRYIKFLSKNSQCTQCGRWTPRTKLTYLLHRKICYRCEAAADRQWADEHIALRNAKRTEQVQIIAEGVRLALLGIETFGSTETKVITKNVVRKLKDMDLNF